MKRNTYTSIIRTLGCLLLLPVFASSCIHEDPELTADGEIVSRFLPMRVHRK